MDGYIPLVKGDALQAWDVSASLYALDTIQTVWSPSGGERGASSGFFRVCSGSEPVFLSWRLCTEQKGVLLPPSGETLGKVYQNMCGTAGKGPF